MRLNVLSEEKSISVGSLFHTLITRSLKTFVRIFRLFDFLNNLYLWPQVCDKVKHSNKLLVFTTTRPKQFYNTTRGQLIICDIL